IQAFRTNGAEAFRGKFRRADVLVVDDVQFFAGKERMQEEFFHTFNALYAERRQIVLASDQPPRDIPNLEARLRSRFECGLITDIHQPDLTLRLAILAQKAKWLGLELPAEVAQLIASKIVSSVRELEGALHRLAAASALARQRLDLQFALQILRPVLRCAPPRTVEEVQRVVAQRFRVSEQDLVCHQRASRLLLPRQVAMYLARKKTAATYAEIAEGFGGRNHTTVMHAVRAIERRRADSPEFAAILDHLETRLETA
ncbi:MAG: chromosomal replication initiator protein DnaA, partial [Candidatus Binatia bacterium]